MNRAPHSPASRVAGDRRRPRLPPPAPLQAPAPRAPLFLERSAPNRRRNNPPEARAELTARSPVLRSYGLAPSRPFPSFPAGSARDGPLHAQSHKLAQNLPARENAPAAR